MNQLATLKPQPSLPSAQGTAHKHRVKSRAAKLSRKQKAAIIVRLLVREGADVPLTDLPDALQVDLTQQMGAMRYVDHATLADVVGEFADELDSIGLHFPNGIAGALNELDGKISPQTAARLRKEAGVRQVGDPWTRVKALPVDRLLEFVKSESTEIAAVLLSKLDTAKAADLLSRLPGPQARRITYTVSLTANVTPDAVDRIGLSLASQLDRDPVRAFAADPDARVGAILNNAPSSQRDELLSALEEEDSTFADQVRKAIFTFDNIPERVQIADVPALTRVVDQDTLTRALAAAAQAGKDNIVDFLLDNMSKRMADNLREEIEDAGKIKPKEGEAAMNAVVGGIRQLADAGEITLVIPDEDEE